MSATTYQCTYVPEKHHFTIEVNEAGQAFFLCENGEKIEAAPATVEGDKLVMHYIGERTIEYTITERK